MGSGSDPKLIFVTPDTYLTSFVAKYFDLMKFQIDPWGLPRVPPGPQGPRGDPKYIVVTLDTYLTTFVSDIL